jgi:hypothetical protein
MEHEMDEGVSQDSRNKVHVVSTKTIAGQMAHLVTPEKQPHR